jgi:M6 family metalloprotease-like protein
LVFGLALTCGTAALADTTPSANLNLREYRTVENAITAKIVPAGGTGRTGYFGAAVKKNDDGQLAVEAVQANSPAAKAGVKIGDVVTRIGDQPVKSADTFREWLQAKGPGDSVKLSLLRDKKPIEITAELAATSRPLKIGGPRVYFGADLAPPQEDEGCRVTRVAPDSPAAKAGVRVGDFLIRVEQSDLSRGGRINDVLASKRPGDSVSLAVRREGQELSLTASLVADRGQGGPGDGGRGGRGGRGGGGGRGGALPETPWKKNVIRLALIGIEFSDIKHNDKAPISEWEMAIFSRGAYQNRKNATGQEVHGSLSDYFREQSGGRLSVEGKAFPWVQVGKKRGEYSQGSGTSNKTAVLVEALDKLTERDGKDALNDFDGFLFIYAGEAVRTNRGAVYYPHAGVVSFQNRRVPYVFGIEGGSRMTPIGGFVKEVSRILGMPDLAARTENQGSEGLGAWCVLSNPQTTSRPQHLSAWAKERMGWVKPTVIDPTVKQKLILAPIEDSPKECFKVLVRPDGSEYFLLENRRKKSFDSELPGEGLLIWRVVNDRPILEEAHGVEGPSGPTVHLNSVPFPTSSSRSFTPETTPSSKSPQGGGLPVHITEIKRLPDGRIAFSMGYEFD